MSFSDSCEQEHDSDAMLWHTTRYTPDEYVATPAELARQRSKMNPRSLILGLVILRRILDARCISRTEFEQAYASEVARFVKRPRASGGDFYLTQAVRLSRRFARAVIANTLEGHTLFRDAFQMLGVSKEQTFRKLERSLEVLP